MLAFTTYILLNNDIKFLNKSKQKFYLKKKRKIVIFLDIFFN